MKSAKFQTPNTKEIPESNSQATPIDARKPPRNRGSVWSLKVGAFQFNHDQHLSALPQLREGAVPSSLNQNRTAPCRPSPHRIRAHSRYSRIKNHSSPGVILPPQTVRL